MTIYAGKKMNSLLEIQNNNSGKLGIKSKHVLTQYNLGGFKYKRLPYRRAPWSCETAFCNASKVGDLSRGWTEASIFNSYNNEV